MALASPGVQQQVEKLSRQVKTLINSDLKEICRTEALPVSGVKAALQRRILDRLEEVNISGDTALLQRLANTINSRRPSPSGFQDHPQTKVGSAAYSPASPTMPAYKQHNGYGQSSRPPAPITFKSSPFYSVLEPLIRLLDLPAMNSHRHTAATQLTLNQNQANQIRNDPSLRIYLFCASDSGLGRYEQSDIAFPSQIEVKVNNEEVKANFKGLKNKPGTTRPADITDFVRKTANYTNSISITYALTQKDIELCRLANLDQKFSLIAHLVKPASVGELTDKIQRRAVIPKQRVVQEMITRANDADIVATSSIMSLKDPVSTVRIQIPCRSTICTHNQCFDVSSFLQLQEQAPTWTCPVCNKLISFEALVIDQYVQDILARTSADQVTIEPDGKWSHGDTTAEQSTNGPNQQDDDSDDDLIDITETRVSQVKKEEPNFPLPGSVAAQTPSQTSRETSSVPHTNSNKRKRSEVIDLTLSDEEDDEPPHRPSKRHAPGTGNGPSAATGSYYTPSPGASLPDPRNGHTYPPSNSRGITPQYSNHQPHRANGISPFNIRPPPPPSQTHPPPPSGVFNPSLNLPPPPAPRSHGSSASSMSGGGGGSSRAPGNRSVRHGKKNKKNSTKKKKKKNDSTRSSSSTLSKRER